MKLGDLKRRIWYRIIMPGAGQNDPFKQLNRMYILKDPWQLDSPGEHARHRETNRVIEAVFGHVGTMLEVGAGEGVQTEYLSKLCDRLTGIETSPRALKRARKRAPGAEILLGQLHEQPWANERDKFDLVVAAEVINHMADVPGFLDRFSRLGRACLITYFAQNRGPLDPIINQIPGVSITRIRYGPTNQKESFVAWWPGSRDGRMSASGPNAITPKAYTAPAV